MTLSHTVLLAHLLSKPEVAQSLTGVEWSEVVSQGRSCASLVRLGQVLEGANLMPGLPPGAIRHIKAAEVVVRRQFQQALFEIGNISEALRPTGCAPILLKGAAYIALGIPAGEGRYLSDIDIMVPRKSIGEAESALMMAGWVGVESDAYNQRYYREWMHEIPPMKHMRRGSVIDLHHTVLPLTARTRIKIDAEKLFQSARPVPGMPCLRVLCPVDMVLHSASHLFYESEFERGLRDLTDFDRLLDHFGRTEPEFWSQLVPRANELGLTQPLIYALRYSGEFLRTPVPDGVKALLPHGLFSLVKHAAMDELFVRALSPTHHSCQDAFAPFARFLLFVRGHWLRMPVRLLIPHLARKFWMKRKSMRAGDAR